MPIHEQSLIRPENLKTHNKLVLDGVDVSGHWSTFIEPRVVTDYDERLINWKNVSWQNRAHFFGVSAQQMRRTLVDFARSRNAQGGGTVSRVTLDEAFDPRKGKIVELRFWRA